MSVRSTALAILLGFAGLSAAHAGSASTFVGGELGFVDQPIVSQVTRAQVRQELDAFRRNPTLDNGATLYVGGEQGYVDLPASNRTRASVRQELLARSAFAASAPEAP